MQAQSSTSPGRPHPRTPAAVRAAVDPCRCTCHAPSSVGAVLDPRRRFLDRVPDARRSWTMNTFLREIREYGARTPADLVSGLERRAAAHVAEAERQRRPDEEERWALLLHGLRGYRAEAVALAEVALEWEGLPAAERARQKAVRAEAGRRAWMATQPVTARQLSYLTALGYQGPEPANRAAASDLIDALRRRP